MINVCSPYIRIAHLQEGVLSDFYLDNLSVPSQVGAIYKARVAKKQVGLDACFVNIDARNSAFLYTGKKEKTPEENSSLLKTSKIKKGQMLMVQVVKDPLKRKNFRVSDKISLPGLYVVYLPNSPFHIGLSRKIEEEKTREKLTQYIEEMNTKEAVIVRTKAVTASKEDLMKDLKKRQMTWKSIQEKYKKQKSPGLIWSDVSFSFQLLRDLLTKEVDQVLVDDEEIFFRMQEYVAQEMPKEKQKISFYKNNKLSLFDKYDLEIELDRLLEKKVKLKSGGFIVIEETEAAVVIDVNTGRFMGKKTPEENILKINIEAAEKIATQIRLRNCGGIVLVDFIDMEEESSRQKVMEVLSYALKEDKSYTQLFPMSELGVVQLTRKRVRTSLLEALSDPCPHCEGRSYIKKDFNLK